MKYFSNFGAGRSMSPTPGVVDAFAECDSWPLHHMRVYVAAATKKQALDTLTNCGFRVNPTYLSTKDSTLADVAATGVLDDGAIYVAHSEKRPSPLFRIAPESISVVAILSADTFSAAA